MKEFDRSMLIVLCLCLWAGGSGCATLQRPQRAGVPADRRGGIDVVFFIADVLLTGGIGLIFDFIHGTIYKPQKDYRGPGSDPAPPVPRKASGHNPRREPDAVVIVKLNVLEDLVR
jgi:hypothetical protein